MRADEARQAFRAGIHSEPRGGGSGQYPLGATVGGGQHLGETRVRRTAPRGGAPSRKPAPHEFEEIPTGGTPGAPEGT